MDWSELAKQMEAGSKLYRMFQDGERIASQLSNAEREAQEIQSQSEVRLAQVDQATRAVQAAQDQVKAIVADGARQATQQQQTFETAHARRVEDANAALNEITNRVAAQTQVFQDQAKAYRAQLDQLQSSVAILQGQVEALSRLKATLKAELQSVG